MTEREIIETIFSIYDRDWSMLQWWGTVSFGLIAVTQLEIQKLSAYIVALLIVLYTIFTAWIGIEYLFNITVLAGFNADLAELGEAAHQGSQALLRSKLVYKGVGLQDLALCMTYVGSIGYVCFAYKTKKN
jgi:hypothetical protein